jgi:hypothetical protein
LKGTEISFCEISEKSLDKYVTLKDEKKKDLSFSRMPVTNLTPVKDYYAPSITSQNLNDNLNSNVNNEKIIFTNSKSKKGSDKVGLSDFKVLKVLGLGSFSKVYLVEHIKSGEFYAMKILKKDLLIEEDQIQNTLLEKKILVELEHQFLIEMIFCFQTEERIYLILPFMSGGELFNNMKIRKTFDEQM